MDGGRGWLAERFEGERARLSGVAYRMLGSRSDAEDALQESWVRISRADAAEIANLGGWLTTVVARVCLDMLRSRKSRREDLVADDPRTREPATEQGPEHEAVLADSIGLALLVVLETPKPGGTRRVRAARHVRRSVRGDRTDRRALVRRGAPAR